MPTVLLEDTSVKTGKQEHPEHRGHQERREQGLPTVESAGMVLEEARRRFGLNEDVAVEWLCQSENTTYLVRYPDGEKAILRIGRLEYHSYEEVATELAWMARLRKNTHLSIPRALTGVDGQCIQRIPHPHSGAEHFCVMFEFMQGTSPEGLSPQEFIDQFETLGEITAILHNDALAWPESAHLPRFYWDVDDLIGPHARLGSWRLSPNLGAERAVIEQTIEVIYQRMAAYGRGPERFGLIHADLRCANLLVNGGQTALIDFDDCAFGYFLYDFGAAVTFIEDHPDIRKLLDAWLRGYHRHRNLDEADLDEIKTFVMLRRICIHGWIVSHWEADDVRNGVGIGYDAVTVDLCKRYLKAVDEGALIW
jgi:Ser/Thr protein kinase RdoA (MazF antagonist)